jgi:putative membrane protein
MTRLAALLGLIGLIVATALYVWHGLGPTLTAFAAAGSGVLWVAASHFISMSLNARAWQILLPHRRRPSTVFFLWAVWLREAVNGLLPVARIGGEVVTARLLIQRGLSPSLAVASLIGDVTISLGSQMLFTLIGIVLLLIQGNESPSLRDVIVGLVLFAPLMALFVLAQKAGFFGLITGIVNRLFGDRFSLLAGSAITLDRTIRRLYRRSKALFFCTLWQMAGWGAGAFEIWLSLYFLQHPTTILNAVIIESLIQALSSSAFVVPGALGVQEGGFVVIGELLGLTAETALALALMRRVRDILVFVPALAIWQFKLIQKLSPRVRA